MLRASGTSGTLRVGYQWAADLGAWVIEPDAGTPPAFTMRATILARHDHWIEQEPLDLVLAFGTVEWVWRGVELRYEKGLDVSIRLVDRPVVGERLAEMAPTAVQAGAWARRAEAIRGKQG